MYPEYILTPPRARTQDIDCTQEEAKSGELQRVGAMLQGVSIAARLLGE
jgi:hypothetical protein